MENKKLVLSSWCTKYLVYNFLMIIFLNGQLCNTLCTVNYYMYSGPVQLYV
jgi:hypothetical protein